ncbi:MAG: nucleotide exchange factor GrpE [Planctomycetes bacterium]|nr:nucleotide exchange factor GrpE [Planctomycetota bacterium]
MSEARPQDREPIEEPPTADEPAPAAPTHEERVRDLEDRLRRTEAEFVNETRRIRRQADEQGRYAAERVVVDLLPVLDALQGARSSLGEGADTAVVREGLDLVERQLADALARHGVERIEAEGLPFDPSCHEAMLMVDDPSRPAQTVAQVLRHGYRLHGRVVRPAQVVVARGGPAPERPAEEAPDADV